ncbi:MAG: O-antigen ligase family protein [Planctomycetes bacterium]|nr:O-antigen ligase family protein [Planctomycetota bacterium]
MIKRIALLTALAFGMLLIFNKASIFVVVALVFICLALLIFKDKAWILLVLAAPTLALGQVIYIPVTTGWVYEARAAELVLVLVAAVYGLYIFFNSKADEVKADKLALLLGVYLLFSLASLAYIVDFRLYIFGLKIVVYSFLAYFLGLNLVDTPHKIRWFLGGMAATAVVLSVQLFWKFYETGWSSKFFFERTTIMIPIGPVATTAAILSLLIPIILGFYLSERHASKTRPFIFLALTLSVLAVFLTLGKAAIASLLVGLLLIFWHTKNKIPFLLFLGWFTLSAYFVFNPYFTGLFERVKTTLIDVNTQFRVTEIKTAWHVIQSHPVLGVGAGQQLLYFKKLLNQEVGQQVNNYFLQTLVDLGLIGLTLGILIFEQIAHKTFTLLKRRRTAILAVGFGAGVLVAFLNGLAEVTIFALPYAIVFWLLFGVMNNLNTHNA